MKIGRMTWRQTISLAPYPLSNGGKCNGQHSSQK